MEVTTLSEQLLFTTVKIDTAAADGSKGSGTGFIFQHKYKDNEYPFVVTNKHVVKGAVKGGITFLKKDGEKPKLGDAFRVDCDDFESQWVGHPDSNIDICVTPLVPLVQFMKGNGVEVFFRNVGSQHIPNKEQEKDLDAFEEVVFVGYPNGIWDNKNYIPIIRKGTTATPLIVDYEGDKKFLIDASVFGGSSGSPVFIYQSGTYSTKNGNVIAGTKFYFVGVVAAVYYKTDAQEIISLPIPTHVKNYAIDKEMIDLGVVFKAETVVQTVEHAIVRFGA